MFLFEFKVFFIKNVSKRRFPVLKCLSTNILYFDMKIESESYQKVSVFQRLKKRRDKSFMDYFTSFDKCR